MAVQSPWGTTGVQLLYLFLKFRAQSQNSCHPLPSHFPQCRQKTRSQFIFQLNVGELSRRDDQRKTSCRFDATRNTMTLQGRSDQDGYSQAAAQQENASTARQKHEALGCFAAPKLPEHLHSSSNLHFARIRVAVPTCWSNGSSQVGLISIMSQLDPTQFLQLHGLLVCVFNISLPGKSSSF